MTEVTKMDTDLFAIRDIKHIEELEDEENDG